MLGIGPTNGIPDNGHVDVWTTIRTNLIALMTAARDREINRPATVLDLEAASGVGKSTIYRILDPGAVNATGIDNLAKIAEAYGLATWQLLVPHLDPREPPKVLTIEEREEIAVMRVVYQQVQAVARGTDFHTPRAPGSSAGNPSTGENSGTKPPRNTSRRS